MSTILQIANADKSLSTLMKTLKGTELEDKLDGRGPFTILAPVNLAFTRLDSSVLPDVLAFHILEEKRLSRDFRDGQKLKTIGGKMLDVTVNNGEVRINGAKLLSKDRQGSNGVVHSIDSVNIPPPDVKDDKTKDNG